MDYLRAELMALVLAVVSAGIHFASQWVKGRVKPQQFQAVSGLAREAVRAAEQLGVDFDVKGQEKFAFAKAAITSAAAKMGLKLSDEEVLTFVHAALADVRNEFGWLSLTAPEES